VIANTYTIQGWILPVGFCVAFSGWILAIWQMGVNSKLEEEIKELKAHVKKIWKYSREELR